MKRLNRFTRVKLALVLILFGLLLFFVQFVICAYPIFENNCKSKAESIGIDIASREINKIMTNYDYEDLVYISREPAGEITMIKVKIVPINEIISNAVSSIQQGIDNTKNVSVQIDIGKVTGISFLSKVGPAIEMKLDADGGVEADLKSEFSESGINQTLHRIYLDVTTNVNIITPFNVISSSYTTQVLLAESIIVGRVPDNYGN